MAVIRKTVDFLPGVFQTEVNKKFLNSTLDQLISEPGLDRINGYIGRQFVPDGSVSSNFITEPSSDRENYQLEPALVVRNSSDQVELFADYQDIVNQISYLGGITENHNRLFESDFYSFDPRIDLDKFVNYGQYYWLPNGPDPVLVTSQSTTQANTFVFTSNANVGVYTTNQTGNVTNPTITVTRGELYTFTVNHPGSNFWIQTEPGLIGNELLNINQSSRDIFGVANNGANIGDILFSVPLSSAQDDVLKANVVYDVDYAIVTSLAVLDGSAWTANVTAFDGEVVYPENKYIIITNTSNLDADWTNRNAQIVPINQRYGIWRMNRNSSNQIELTFTRTIGVGDRVYVRNGDTYGGRYYVKPTANSFVVGSAITAPLTTLYYQNSANPEQYGKIEIIDSIADVVDVASEIVGRRNFTAPNGVEFVNGLKIRFDDTVTPSSYRNRVFIVEGVGTSIRLVDFSLLVAPEVEGAIENVPFDTVNFDVGNFDESFRGSPVPDYITINRASTDLNAWSRSNRWFHVDIINLVAKYNSIPAAIDQTKRAQRPIIEFIADLALFNSGRRGIGSVDRYYDSQDTLYVNATQVVLNDAFTQINGQTITDINNKGIDLQVGFRVLFSNDLNQAVRQRVYRVDPIDQTAAGVYDGTLTGNIEIKLGSERVVGEIGVSVFVQQLANNSEIYTSSGQYIGRVLRVLSDNEFLLTKPSIVNYNVLSGVKFNSARITLTETALAQRYDSIVVTGGKKAKNSYVFDLNSQAQLVWRTVQQKTKINQEPLFDVFSNGNTSISTSYFNSTFAGTKLFSYRQGSSAVDPVLGFPLSYNNSTGSIGDIIFTNNFNTDTFTYTASATDIQKITAEISVGYIGRINTNGTISQLNLWNRVDESTRQFKHITDYFTGDTNFFEIGVAPFTATYKPSIIVYINNKILERSSIYTDLVDTSLTPITTTVVGNNAAKYGELVTGFYREYLGRIPDQTGLDYWVGTIISGVLNVWEVEKEIGGSDEAYTLSSGYQYINVGVRKCVRISANLLTQGDRVDIFVRTNETSDIGFYTVPTNLELNPQNQEIETVTMGQIRNHLYELGKNNLLVGTSLGQSNLRNLSYTGLFGTILQHSAPLIYTPAFLNHPEINFVNSIDYARKEYTRFKNKLLEASQLPGIVDLSDIPGSLDRIITQLNEVKNSTFPWYYSDMFAYGDNYVSIKHTVTNPNVVTYNTTVSYQNLSVGNRAATVYRNNELLIRGRDYTFDTSPTVTLTGINLAANDVIEIREYANTDGCFVPETPTKLGLYPKFIPSKFTDNTYRTSQLVIQGHDGSITVAFGDYRDDLLLELEKRIYNNLKVDYDANLFDIDKIVPGYFRTTDYSRSEFLQVMNQEFMSWVGHNQIDFATNQWFLGNDEFTWNYSRALAPNNEKLPGYWRSIYRYFYDTDRPHTHPWEMMGYTIKPTWWDTYYSWTDPIKRTALIASISNGYIYNPSGTQSTVKVAKYARSGFSGMVPVSSAGALLPPMRVMVRQFNANYASQDFQIGDQGPVETAWVKSSEYPFALQKVLALLKPARYFGMLFDTSRYRAYLLNNKIQYAIVGSDSRPNSKAIVVNGYETPTTTTRATGYPNWIHGYLTSFGYDAGSMLRNHLDNIDINLSHKMAGFTDKRYLNVLADQYSPSSSNESVIIPDENYDVYLNSSVPLARAVYSAVIVERTGTGYRVSGYDLDFPYFTIIPSETAGSSSTISVLDSTAVIFEEFKTQKVLIPYGYVLSTKQQVVDFLIGHQRYQQAQGFVFDQYDSDLGFNRDWLLSVREFITWTKQGWRDGNILVLSPVGNSLKIYSDEAVVDNITNRGNESELLGANFRVIRNSDFTILRDSRVTTISTVSNQPITFAQLKLVQFEHVLIFDNVTVFNDIIYNTDTGNRQRRLRLIGSKTNQWDGQLTPPGFIYNNGKIDTWEVGKDYRKGDIVTYKNRQYTASQDIVASETFNPNLWTITDSIIIGGMVPNFAYNAAKLVDIYDIDQPPLDEELAKFSAGLIGYRSRPYLTELGMSEISQTKFYQGYIKQKGTRNAINAITRGEFGSMTTQVNLREEWAARIGEYGSIDANPSIQFRLNHEHFGRNPAAFELLGLGQTATSNLSVGIGINSLSSRPKDYTPNIFLDRNPQPSLTFKIELFGDSIMCGRDGAGSVSSDYLVCRFNRSTGRVASPPDNLLYQLTTAPYQIAVTTRSVQGSTSGQLLTGLDGVNSDWPDDIEAEIVVINHGLEDARQGVLVSTYKQNLRNLRLRLPPTTIVVWQTPTQVNTNLTSSWNNSQAFPLGTNNIAPYAEAMREVCAEYSDFLADAYNIENWSVHLGADGVHPNQTGYYVLVQTVLAPVVRRAIKYYLRSRVTTFDNDIVSAGYVNKDDVDSLIFDISDFTSVSQNTLSELDTDYKIWVAKDFDRDWNVYRAFKNTANISQIINDVDNRITIQCDAAHGISSGDIIALRNIDALVDGYYNAVITDSANITVEASESVANALKLFTLIPVAGELFDFQPLRYPTLQSFSTASPKHGWRINDFVWVDDLDDDRVSWAVLQKPPTMGPLVTTSIVHANALAYSSQINIYYRNYLSRNAELGGLDFWTGLAVNNVLTLSQIEAAIRDSDEGQRLGFSTYRRQEPRVDLDSVNNIYLYSAKDRRILSRVDLLDPNKGRILGIAQSDLDYTISTDPARYNAGLNTTEFSQEPDIFWATSNVGKYWWNIDVCRFVDYEQDTISYRINNWASLFPGSLIHVYEWIESEFLPSEHVSRNRDGTPLYANDEHYSTRFIIDPETGIARQRYYYWVRNSQNKRNPIKNMSTASVAEMIQQPIDQNIPYAAVLKNNSMALYNVGSYINGQDTMLYVSSQKIINQNIIHSEFALVQEESLDSEIPARIENKIIDSLVGADKDLNVVPDPNLPELDRIGLGLRPRQSVVINRLTALRNVITYVNSVLETYPASSRLINNGNIFSDNFYAQDPLPPTTAYAVKVDRYIDLPLSPSANQRVLVVQDETKGGYWTIYQRNSANTAWLFVQRQQFDVTKHWEFIDWYASGYSNKTKARYVVKQYKDIQKLSLVSGDIVRVLNVQITTNSGSYNTVTETMGKFELYLAQAESGQIQLRLIGLESGTFRILENFYQANGFDADTYDNELFDSSYFTELRYVFAGIKHDVFINDLKINYSRLMFFIIENILSEQKYVDWFFKTSFVTVFNQVQGLIKLPNYVRERRDLYESFIREVKPYRTKIRNFTASYSETETPSVSVTDFDLPGYYDANLSVYRSPTGTIASDAALFTTANYQDWFKNYGYQIKAIDIASPGYGYKIDDPSVSIIRTDTEIGSNAQARITLNPSRGIDKVYIDAIGSNYVKTPLIDVIGPGGTLYSDVQTYGFRVVSVGGDYNGANVAAGLYNLTTGNVVSNTSTNGYTVHAIRRSDGELVFTRDYNIINQAAAGYSGFTSSDMAVDINSFDNSYVVIVRSFGNPEPNRLGIDLLNAMYRIGASAQLFGSSTEFKSNAAYVLAGIPGSGTGAGLENYMGTANNAVTSWTSIEFRLQRGNLIPVRRVPKYPGFASPISFPLSPVANQTYSYGSQTWLYTGQRWRLVLGQVKSKLPGEVEPSRALLVPRLGNDTVRKLRTVIRFDRIQYTTQVYDWEAGGFDSDRNDNTPFDPSYPAGTYLSYQGQGYITTSEMLGGPRFVTANAELVGIRESITSRRYRNGFFENANDRIMAFYQPTTGMTPKDLTQLIPGIDSPPLVEGNYTVTGDTILLGDTFSSTGGLPSSNIKINGGTFISNIFSHAPEELLPGSTYDTMTIRVTVNNQMASGNVINTYPNLSATSFGMFKDFSGNVEYFEIANYTTTALAQDLLLTDSNIVVVDGAVLGVPNPNTVTPGVIYVNGERIQYYTKNGNTLGQIRRGRDLTGATVHRAGAVVYDVGYAALTTVIKQ